MYVRGEFNEFVELGIFLYNSRIRFLVVIFFILVQCKTLSVD